MLVSRRRLGPGSPRLGVEAGRIPSAGEVVVVRIDRRVEEPHLPMGLIGQRGGDRGACPAERALVDVGADRGRHCGMGEHDLTAGSLDEPVLLGRTDRFEAQAELSQRGSEL